MSSALVASKGSIATYGPVTGDDKGKRVVCQSIAHCSRAISFPQMSGDELIGADASPGNPVLGTQNTLLKLTSQG